MCAYVFLDVKQDLDKASKKGRVYKLKSKFPDQLYKQKKQTPWPFVRERTIPTDRPDQL
jgi:hypothetical protein